MRGAHQCHTQFQSPSLLLIRTRREVEETGDGDQATTSEHAEVDTAGQWRAPPLGPNSPGEADRVDLRMSLLVYRSEVPKRGAAHDIGN